MKRVTPLAPGIVPLRSNVEVGGDAMTLQPTSTFERSGTMPGASGVTRFTMKPQTPGDYTLVFMLVPPGVTGAEVGRAFVGLHIQ